MSADDSAMAAAEVFDLPEKIAQAERRRYVVVFDEFQEILRLDGSVLERQLRAAIQHHNHVSYLFAGSKTHMLIDMITDETRPFYQMGTLMNLDKIPFDEFSAFVANKFTNSNRHPTWPKASGPFAKKVFSEKTTAPTFLKISSSGAGLKPSSRNNHR
jgi:hypothetical protein